MSDLETWERVLEPAAGEHDLIPLHWRNGIAPSTPSARLLELTLELERTKQHLADACAEVRRLRGRDARWHSFTSTSFAGIPMAQYWTDFFLWEALLNENEHLRAIVELGTWKGGFSLWLHAQAENRDMCFRTYDVIKPERQPPNFVQIDIYAEAEEIGKHLKKNAPLILLCDGGNKPRELRTFSMYLKPDSVIVVHDWGTEMLPGDVPDNVEMVYGDFCDEIGSISRVFRVKE